MPLGSPHLRSHSFEREGSLESIRSCIFVCLENEQPSPSAEIEVRVPAHIRAARIRAEALIQERINDLRHRSQQLSDRIKQYRPRASKRSIRGFISKRKVRAIQSFKNSAQRYDIMEEKLRSNRERLENVENLWRSYCDEEAQSFRKAKSGLELICIAVDIDEEFKKINQAITEVEARYHLLLPEWSDV
ncbi:hypothetical protein HD806DRAFT_536810 [Xylariaceae sp. AK1471]|nr:hypothetical protein HD806DRAFT_536810 [Xylariaceae sp. AK1471]